MSENHIDGKVIIVTGAAGGFGRLVCQKTAALGARIIACDINAAELNETTSSITAAGAYQRGLLNKLFTYWFKTRFDVTLNF